jgi:hypothetical protein
MSAMTEGNVETSMICTAPMLSIDRRRSRVGEEREHIGHKMHLIDVTPKAQALVSGSVDAIINIIIMLARISQQGVADWWQ